MIQKFPAAICLTLFLASALHAAPILTFLAPGADLSGPAGSTVTWNFQIDNDSGYLLVSQVNYSSLSPVGAYTDNFSFIAPVIGPAEFATGSGDYAIDLPAPSGYLSTGQIVVTYDLFGVSPDDPNFDPEADLIAAGLELSGDASVLVEATAVPEPSTIWYLLGAGGALALYAKRRRRRG